MWEVTTKQNCQKDLILCGQRNCELCHYMSELWNDQAKGWNKRLGNVLEGGYFRDVYERIEPDGREIGGWWEDNYYKMQKMKIATQERLQVVQNKIRIDMGAGIKHQLWSIGLPEDYDLKKMQKKLEELVLNDKYQMGQSLACYEFHSEKHPEGGNLHMHILVINHGTYKPCKKKELLMNHFGLKSDNFIDYQTNRKPKDFQNGVNYILGDKAGEEKAIYAEKDKVWREKVMLPQFTSSLPEEIYDTYVKERLNKH